MAEMLFSGKPRPLFEQAEESRQKHHHPSPPPRAWTDHCKQVLLQVYGEPTAHGAAHEFWAVLCFAVVLFLCSLRFRDLTVM